MWNSCWIKKLSILYHVFVKCRWIWACHIGVLARLLHLRCEIGKTVFWLSLSLHQNLGDHRDSIDLRTESELGEARRARMRRARPRLSEHGTNRAPSVRRWKRRMATWRHLVRHNQVSTKLNFDNFWQFFLEGERLEEIRRLKIRTLHRSESQPVLVS